MHGKAEAQMISARITCAGIAAYAVAKRCGLGPIAAAAIRRKAMDQVKRGSSAARAISEARATAIAMRAEPWSA